MIGILLALLPRGLYNVDPGSSVRASLEAEAEALQTLEDSTSALLQERFVPTAEALLGSFERVHGISPSPGATVAVRRAELLARIRLEPSLSRPFLAAAASEILGYEPAIRETHVVRVGPSRVGIVDEARLLPLNEVNRWYVDLDPALTDRETYDRRPLNELIEYAKPAYTEAHVGFPGPFTVEASQVHYDQVD